MKKRVLIPLLVLLAAIIAVVVYSLLPDGETSTVLMSKVEEGNFEILVTVTGELQAQKSTEIKAPPELRSRSLRIRTVTIQQLIPEGTVVDSGDWVATLDRSEADNSLKDKMDELEQIQSNFTKTQLDTTMQLRQLRNDLINLKFSMEEMKIALEQSKYEPPATIRQAQINLNKAQRAYEQAENNYHLKVQQAVADMNEVSIKLAKEKRGVEEMREVLNNFDIMAPASGMVIYKRDWNGSKRTVGTEVSAWDPVVAELPDLSTLISRTYVNEIDISKVLKGQKVRVGVDAFPEKSYTGRVIEVANIGEQLPNTDAKVFEVVIKVFGTDPILRPSMTTSNQIITMVYDSVLYIPLETVHTNDSLSYVYTRRGTRQVVVLGDANENSIIVEQGLTKGEEIYLSVPEEPEKFRWSGMDLVKVIREKEAEKKRLQEELAKKSKPGEKGFVPGEQRRKRPKGNGDGNLPVRPQ